MGQPLLNRIVACLLLFPPLALAAEIPQVIVRSCYDGDTCRVDLPRALFADEASYRLFGENVPVRFLGIDAPEKRGRCPEERALAKTAREFVLRTIGQGRTVTLADVQRGKYFRLVARVLVDGVDLSTLLMKHGLAAPYDGGTKVKDWCE